MIGKEIQNIVALLTRTFERDAWHGPSVKEVLQEITQEQSQAKIRNTHSIVELVGHMASWRTFVIKKMQGDIHFNIGVENNSPTSSDWRQTLSDLYDSQAKLLQQLNDFPEVKLAEIVPQISNPYTFYTLLHGIVHHDLYHLGQIVLIKKSIQGEGIL